MIVDNIAILSALTPCTLIYSVWNLKTLQLNVQRGAIQELVFYKFELDYYAVQETQNICCV